MSSGGADIFQAHAEVGLTEIRMRAREVCLDACDEVHESDLVSKWHERSGESALLDELGSMN